MNGIRDTTNKLKTNIQNDKTLLFYSIISIILFLIIALIYILYKGHNLTSNLSSSQPYVSKESLISSILMVVFFSILIVIICISILGNFKQIKQIFEQINDVTYVIIYTIFLILFFTLMPPEKMNDYAFIILPITIFLGTFLFYKSYKTNYILNFNVEYERIKSLILFFCLITIFIIYYNVDPGGYIKKYFGYTFLITIILSVFAFLYLIVILTVPTEEKKINSYKKTDSSSNFLNNFSNISSYGSGLFITFIIAITIIISTYPGGFFNNKTVSASSIIIILIICILWCLLLGTNLFSDSKLFDNFAINSKIDLYKKSLLVLFGIVISCLIIFWLVYIIQSYSGYSSIIDIILNVIIVIIVLSLIYKTINVNLPAGNAKKNAFFNLILNIIFYVPCFFGDTFDKIGDFFIGQYNETSLGSIIVLIIAILLLVGIYGLPSMLNKVNVQGGKQLLENPVFTDSYYSLATYQELNKSDNPDYQYAISFWVFFDAVQPNTNASSSKYTSILNFGNKPNILYNTKKNTFIVTIEEKYLKGSIKNNVGDFDENNNRILYKHENVLLQRWNNIIINYSAGFLDIFLNGELVKSNIGVVPYYTLENLSVGQENGVKGGICNVVYFNNSLNASNIYYLYNLVKNKNPPLIDNYYKTIQTHKQNTNTGDTQSGKITFACDSCGSDNIPNVM